MNLSEEGEAAAGFLHSVMRQLALRHNRTDGKARPKCDRSSTRIAKLSSDEYVCKRSCVNSFFFFSGCVRIQPRSSRKWYKVTEFSKRVCEMAFIGIIWQKLRIHILRQSVIYNHISYCGCEFDMVRFDMICSDILCQQNIYLKLCVKNNRYYSYLAFF